MKKTIPFLLLAGLLRAGLPVVAQQPVLNYTLAVNTADCSAVQITMRVRNVATPFHLAMVKHFLNDDRYWRFVDDLQISVGTVAREGDGLWRVAGAGSDTTVRYKIRLGENGGSRVVQRPFLNPTGALLGDLHMFMYVVEAPQAPAPVALELPRDWSIATPLTPTSDPRAFYARNAQELSDSPILAGKLREWRFQVDQTPIRVAYWPRPDAKAFDEKAMVEGLQKLVQAAANIFGGLPFREYVFQIRDGADEAGFEHFDCVTLRLNSATLAADPHANGLTIAHEFFHAWNVMRIHSAEYTGPDYRPVDLSGLWFCEGITLFYADLLLRRAGLPTDEPTRTAHLEQLIATYLGKPINARCSAEQSSRVAFHVGELGEYQPDTWLQGELIGSMLDLIIRDATDGKRSLDDLMRSMFAHFSGERGFTTQDIQRLASEVSGRDLKPFFEAYVRGARPIDFNQYLRLAGLKMEVELRKATSPDGTLMPDQRIEPWVLDGENSPKLALNSPDTAWERAGLRTGDQVLKFNGVPIETEDDFTHRLKALHIGDRVSIEVMRAGTVRPLTVAIGSYDWPVVKIRELADASNRQKEILTTWKAGK